MSIEYLSPSLGIILRKFFHGLPLGSLRKNLTLSISDSFLLLAARPFEFRHVGQQLIGRQKVHQA
jgi:hypothetical protein